MSDIPWWVKAAKPEDESLVETPQLIDTFKFEVEVKLRKNSGPKAALGYIIDNLHDILEDKDVEILKVHGAEYEITSWVVTDKFYDGKP